MIKVDMKHGVISINGDMVSVLEDFTMICHQMREVLSDAEDEKFADRTIAFCVALSRKTPEDLKKELEREAANETDDTESAD